MFTAKPVLSLSNEEGEAIAALLQHAANVSDKNDKMKSNMNREKAEQQAEELIGMNFNIPADLTAPVQAKLENELARQLQKSKVVGKVFWAGAAAILIINAIGIGLHFSGNTDLPGKTSAAGSAEIVAGYYYTDKLNSY